tara:strand:+ start:2019 stop:2447 length:429 start_codon:yes stop_codon:yes gene_type:complete
MTKAVNTRVEENTLEYYLNTDKSVYDGIRLAIESFPVLMEETIANIKPIFNSDKDIQLLINSCVSIKSTPQQLASRRNWEAMLGDYYDLNRGIMSLDKFNELISALRSLNPLERLYIRRLLDKINKSQDNKAQIEELTTLIK